MGRGRGCLYVDWGMEGEVGEERGLVRGAYGRSEGLVVGEGGS